MAYYGRINGTTSNSSISCYISYTCIPSTKYNNTEVRATLYYSRTDGYKTYGTWSGSLTINGNTKTGSTSIQLNGSNTVSVISHTVTVPHNADGTKSITISASGGASGTTLTSTSCSKKITLEPIPRQANLTAANDFNDEGNPIITYNNLAGNAVSSLQACIADANGNVIHVAYRDIDKTGTTYTFNLTDAERTALLKAYTTSNSNTVKFYVKTVIGEETFYSSLAKTFSIVNGGPTLNPTAIDVDGAMTALTGNNNNIVKYYSDIQYAANAAARKQATIKSYKITCGSASSTTATGTFTNVSTATVVFSVTDSRGNTTTQTLNKTLIPYIKLTNDIAVNAPTTDGKLSLTASGSYFSGSFGANSNTLTVQYRYKTNSGEYGDWITINATVDAANNKYTATANLTGLNYKNSYTFQTRAIDKIITIAAAEKKVKTTPVFDWGSNDFEFNVPVTAPTLSVDNTITINNKALNDWVFETGTVDGWDYKKWKNGKVEMWKAFNVNVATQTPYGVGYYNGSVLSHAFPRGLTIARPYIFLSVTPSNAQIYSINLASATESSFSYYISCMATQAENTMQVNIYAYGFQV